MHGAGIRAGKRQLCCVCLGHEPHCTHGFLQARVTNLKVGSVFKSSEKMGMDADCTLLLSHVSQLEAVP